MMSLWLILVDLCFTLAKQRMIIVLPIENRITNPTNQDVPNQPSTTQSPLPRFLTRRQQPFNSTTTDTPLQHFLTKPQQSHASTTTLSTLPRFLAKHLQPFTSSARTKLPIGTMRKSPSSSLTTYSRVPLSMVALLRENLNRSPPPGLSPGRKSVGGPCSFLSGSPHGLLGRCTASRACRVGRTDYTSRCQHGAKDSPCLVDAPLQRSEGVCTGNMHCRARGAVRWNQLDCVMRGSSPAI